MRDLTLRILATTALCHVALTAQTQVYAVDAEQAGLSLGQFMESVDDLDGDGRRDLIALAPGFDSAAGDAVGKVYALSGVDGSLIWSRQGAVAAQRLGTSVCDAGDVNGDGVSDIVVLDETPVGAIVARRLNWLSGVNGALIRSRISDFSSSDGFGEALANVLDVDGDGAPDLAVGIPRYGGGRGRVEIYSGATALVIWGRFGPNTMISRYGHGLARLDNWDGNGEPVLAIGAPFHTIGFQACGRVEIRDLGPFTFINEVVGAPGDLLGYHLSNLGDVDGDSRSDLSATAHGSATYTEVYLANELVVARRFTPAEPSDHFGWHARGAGDIDGDGWGDILISSSTWTPGAGAYFGRVFAYSIRDGRELFRLEGESSGHLFGRFIAGGLDTDGDSTPEFAVSVAGYEGSAGAGSGRIEIWRPSPIAPHTYCPASVSSAGCVAQMQAIGNLSATAASGLQLHVSNVEGQKLGLVFYGVNGAAEAPWGASSTLCVRAPTQRTGAQSSGGTSGACDGSLTLDWLAFVAAPGLVLGEPFAPGDAFWAQGWFRDPASAKTTALSRAVQVTLAP